MYVNHHEPVHKHPAQLASPSLAYVSEGSAQSNHTERMWKTSTHLVSSAQLWFEKVRGGSMYVNHPKLVQKHPAHLASPVKIKWKTSTHLASAVMKWFEKVRGGSMLLNHPELLHEHPAHRVSPGKL